MAIGPGLTSLIIKSVIKDSMDTKTYGFVPNNDGGGTVSPQGYATLFAWMNAQTNQ